jgi:hypothetical protein
VHPYLVVIWCVVALALLVIIYTALGGRALLRTKERPERILGKRCQLSELESGPKGADALRPPLPPAVVDSFSPTAEYTLRFDQPVDWLGRTETYAVVCARHVGVPVSLATGWAHGGVWVNGRFGSGEQFIAAFRLLAANRAES